jgi:hypothetical protein
MPSNSNRSRLIPYPSLQNRSNNLDFVRLNQVLGDPHDRMLGQLLGIVGTGTPLQDKAVISQQHAQVEYATA